MEELFCSYELSKLLKEKGYNEPCLTCYIPEDGLLDVFENEEPGWMSNSDLRKEAVATPLFQQVVDWFREKHNLDLAITNMKNTTNHWEGRLMSIIYSHDIKNGNLDWDIDVTFNTYYEALDNTIKEALKLI